MKVTPRFIIRAGLVLSAAGAIGAFGACKDKGITPPQPPASPPPPSAPAAPINVQATAASETAINVTWTDASENEDGFKVQACSGASCTNFAEVGSVAANATTFANTGLTANTEYSYRVVAFNAVGANTSTPAKATTKPIIAPPAGTVMIGAGEITTCRSEMNVQTAALVKGVLAADPNAIAFTAGNNLANNTAGTTYEQCFTPTWGDFKARAYYVPGDSDFGGGRRAEGVYGYFGDRTGPANQGWFSIEKGNWHIIFLNTTSWELGNTLKFGPGSEQVSWLANDLSKVEAAKCIMVVSWERRIYTTGTGTLGRGGSMNTVATMLYNAGADLIVSAKDKIYSRFPQLTPDGVKDEARGFAQFIVGTGGRSLDALPPLDATNPSPVAARAATHGVLKLTLNADSYDYEFVPVTTGAFADKGTTKCHQ